ncbi:MAG: trypsin-like serine peptidase [Allorhizobium sp.]
MKYRSTITPEKRSDLTHAALTCLAFVLLAACGMPPALNAADLKIDDDKPGGLSAAEIAGAIATPSEEVTPEALEEMKQRFRDQNPDVMEFQSTRPDTNLGAKGVPEKIANPNANSPYWSTGALFYKKEDGDTYRCTAQFTNDKSVILTAAHCVYNTMAAKGQGAWNSDFEFWRAYANGVTPQKVGWRCISIFDAYHTPSKNYAYDYAFILTDQQDQKTPLALHIGTPATKPLTAVGYPDNYGAGQYLYKVDGDWDSVSGGIVTMKGNPMRQGNSGGAWFSSFKVDGGSTDNYVVSLNSHHLTGNTEDENGPLFTADTQRLMEHVAAGKCL